MKQWSKSCISLLFALLNPRDKNIVVIGWVILNLSHIVINLHMNTQTSLCTYPEVLTVCRLGAERDMKKEGEYTELFVWSIHSCFILNTQLYSSWSTAIICDPVIAQSYSSMVLLNLIMQSLSVLWCLRQKGHWNMCLKDPSHFSVVAYKTIIY